MIAATRIISPAYIPRQVAILAACNFPGRAAKCRDQRSCYRAHASVAARASHAASASLGMSDWPCRPEALAAAKQFLRTAVGKGGKIVLAPDRDADGLCAGKQPCATHEHTVLH